MLTHEEQHTCPHADVGLHEFDSGPEGLLALPNGTVCRCGKTKIKWEYCTCGKILRTVSVDTKELK